MANYVKIDPEFKVRWVADLRAHGELQGTGCLRSRDNKFCCLGRAAEIANIPSRLVCNSYEYQFDIHRTDVVPVGFYGLNNLSLGELVNMNDTGKTFAEIADWIEENL